MHLSAANGRYNGPGAWLTTVTNHMGNYEVGPNRAPASTNEERCEYIIELGVELDKVRRDKESNDYCSEKKKEANIQHSPSLADVHLQMRQFEHDPNSALGATNQDRYQRRNYLGAAVPQKAAASIMFRERAVLDYDLCLEETFVKISAFYAEPWLSMLQNSAAYQSKEFTNLKMGKSPKLIYDRIRRFHQFRI